MASESLCEDRYYFSSQRPERYMPKYTGVRENSPELSHFDVLKLLQDEAYEHLKPGKYLPD